MTSHRTLALVLFASFFVFASCKKMRFNHELKGDYKGAWEDISYYHSYPQIKVVLDVVSVETYKKGNYNVSWNTQDNYESDLALEYDGSDEYETFQRYLIAKDTNGTHIYRSVTYKLIFKPKADSLIIYTTDTPGNAPVFRGKKQ